MNEDKWCVCEQKLRYMNLFPASDRYRPHSLTHCVLPTAQSRNTYTNIILLRGPLATATHLQPRVALGAGGQGGVTAAHRAHAGPRACGDGRQDEQAPRVRGQVGPAQSPALQVEQQSNEELDWGEQATEDSRGHVQS